MKNCKRIISLILTLAVVAGFNIPARAASGSMESWGVSKYNGVEADYMLDNEVFHSGGTSLKMTRKSPRISNVYMMLSQSVNVELGKTYQFSFWAKAKNMDNITTLIDWGKRAPLNPVMSTYDWTYFTFKYDADHSGAAAFKILVDGPTSAFWVDDLEFYEYDGKKVGKNLFKNPGFEGANVEVEAGGSGKADEFKAEEFYAKLSTSDIIPVYKAKDIVIDGDISDWADATTMKNMPSDKARHIQKYATDVTDAVVDMSFAYDEKYFYFLTVAKDDTFYDVEGSQYWSGDSIQMCLSEEGLNYGAEIGYAFSENGEGKYSLDFGPGEMAGIQLKMTRNDDYTYFESAIPWELYYKEFKDEIVFCAIYNDNDGGGRKYAIQMAPGIAEGKLAAAFPTLRMVPEENNFFAWCEGEQTATVYENNEYEICVLNNSDADKEFTITLGEDVKTVSVPAQTGKRTKVDVVFDKAGDNTLDIVVSDGESEQKFGYKVSVIATPDYYDEALVDLKAKADEIKSLISQCKAKGIPTDYEEPVAFLLERWDEYIRADAKENYYDIMEYTFTELNRMYEETKATLEAYLAGEKTALATPKYVTSDVKIDGQTHWATTVWSDGTEEYRPVFFIGYGHFLDARNDIPNFQNLGHNTLQQEVGVYNVISDRNGIPAYSFGGVGTQTKFEIIKNKAEAPSGSNYLKVTNTTPLAANKYKQLKQSVTVKPNTTYEYGGKLKATNAKKFWMSCVEWPKTEDGRKQLGGDYAWKDVQYEYTTGPEETSLMMHILVEDTIEELLIDDLFIREKGTKKNLLTNPGFEEKFEDFGENKRASDLKIQWVFDMLKNAEENNLAVSLLLSPHYWPGAEIFKDESVKNLTGGARFMTMKSEETREIISKYLDYLLPEAGKYKSLTNICITNEPHLDTQQNEAYYHDDFVAYLRDVYNDDLNEYNRINGTSHASFDDVKMPTGILPSVLMYDWKNYNDTVVKEWNVWMEEQVHKHLPNIPVHHKIMSTTFEDDSALKIHIRYGSDFEDYADVSDTNGCDAFNYFNPVKQPQGVGYNTNPTTTDVYEKFSWYDLMVSNKFAPVYNTEDHVIVDNYPTYDRRIGVHVASDMWQSALHGRGYTNIWVWARSYTQQALKKSILTRPDAINEVSKASLDVNRLSYEVAALADDAAEVGVLWSDTTRLYSDAYLNSWYKTYESTVHNGQKVNFVTDNKINEIHNYDVMIFPSVLNIKADRLPEILEYARSGKTLVLLSSESLKRDEHNQPHDEAIVSEIYKNAIVIENVLDGPKMTKPDDLQKQFADIFDKHNLRRVRVIDTDTGHDVKNVEFMYTEYNGKLLLNMVLYDWTKNRNVKVLVDGQPVTSALELRSMTHYGENFELETCRPILLQIDSDIDINKDAVELQIGNPVMRIDGKRKIIDTESYDTVPVVVGDRTLMPVRAIVEAIGGEVSWDDATQTATLKYNGKELKLIIGSDKAYVDGTEHTLDVVPQLINSRTMLPVRFVAESFGLNVDWYDAGEIVTITK